jgi:hypothetical protein
MSIRLNSGGRKVLRRLKTASSFYVESAQLSRDFPICSEEASFSGNSVVRVDVIDAPRRLWDHHSFGVSHGET